MASARFEVIAEVCILIEALSDRYAAEIEQLNVVTDRDAIMARAGALEGFVDLLMHLKLFERERQLEGP